MGRFSGWWVLAILIGFLMAGCYNQAARTKDRLDNKLADWREKHPGKDPTKEEVQLMADEAEKEEKAARAAELAEAGKNLTAGASSALRGDYVGGAILAAGALLAWLGFRKKDDPAPKEGGTA